MNKKSVLRKILFQLSQDEDGYPPISVEGIWARDLNGAWTVDNIPFYVYGIGPADIISVKGVGEDLWFDKLVQSAGSSIFRISAKNKSNIDNIRGDLLGLSCPSEVYEGMGLIAVEVPLASNIAPVLDFLVKGKYLNDFDFEEGVLRHEIPSNL